MDEYIIALLKCKGVGNVKLYNFLKKYRFNMELIKKSLCEILNENDLENFDYYLKLALKEISENRKNGINLITVLDKNYPIKLLTIKEPILYLYYKGNIELLNKKSVAIIGSRKINIEDEKNTIAVSEFFSKRSITVISGLALGTDTFAHLGSFKNTGSTIAVLPCGLDLITPNSNSMLALDIIENGGLLVSEYPMGYKATSFTFVKRDRIQASLADSILVIKAKEDSGTMHAVKVAKECNKYVAQLKGNNNKLIDNVFEINDESLGYVANIISEHEDTIDSEQFYEQTSLF